MRQATTADVPESVMRAARELMDVAFRDFSDHDWEHALGGRHAWVEDDAGRLLAHGSLVARTLWAGERALHAGYVEAVAVAPEHQRRGLGGVVMAALEAHADAHDLLALCASGAGHALYRSRGWLVWPGPTGLRAPGGDEPTPEEDGAVLVRPGRVALADLDLAGPLWCDPRPGDVW